MGPRWFKIASFTFVCLLLFTSKSRAQFMQDERHLEVALRMIGHRILLSSGDSISRILPIKREDDDRYRIQFESEFEFYPEELVNTIDQVANETRMSTHYIVEVEHCETGEVVYSYEMNILEQTDIIPCKSRLQLKSCYHLLFTFMDSDEPMVASQDIAQGPSNGSLSKKGQVTYSIAALLLVSMLGAFVFLWRRRRNSRVDPNLISLGEYQFDKRNTELLFGNQRTELTGKEADLLLLLYKAVNTGVEREVILNKVWGDQGDYVGRTLDVFISKLRKKFESDPKVKIVNIRGVGYKLVIGV
ncbi:winged helix-turn-helix domain-containing protein [Ulvibacterium sp.]|uniref:winged helix-turn-helix transcriptional regulator n=1 Tax=Ulvibacterium sp. TaxID=2665914 RepID=UPI003BAA1780